MSEFKFLKKKLSKKLKFENNIFLRFQKIQQNSTSQKSFKKTVYYSAFFLTKKLKSSDFSAK